VFESVLNPKKEDTKVEEPIEEEAKEQVAEETQVEEGHAHVEEKFDRRRKEKEVVEEEIPEEERLNRPEGAISLAEHREAMKEKNKKLAGPEKAKIIVTLPSDLKVIEKENVAVKAKKTIQTKKNDNKIQQVDVNFKTEDLSNANARYQKPGFQQQTQQKAKPQKAKINFDDLPTL
jgi:hypothetical protein